MLFRFCLYGFLKNQQYFEPFLILAFLAKGLDFFAIGLLVAARELTVNLVEIPSGALADLHGRRRAMMVSFVAYILSFVTLATADHPALLALAMGLYGVGDAFRTGTHKAMIFTWLRTQGREAERTRVYGMTRAWSKVGSAVAVVVGAILVLVADDYRWLFWAALMPYVLGLINFLGYPRSLEGDGPPDGGPGPGRVFGHLFATVKAMWRERAVRGLVFESMGFEGTFKAVKDYLQPLLQAAAILWLASALGGVTLGDAQRTALLVGPVYFGLYLLSAGASRHAHRLSAWAGSDDRAAAWLWAAGLLLLAGLVPALWFDLRVAAIAAFAALFVLQNAWRPILIARYDTHADARQGATLLSVENQAKSLATMLLAPAIGALVDWAAAAGVGGSGGLGLVPAVGLAAAAGFVSAGRLTARR